MKENNLDRTSNQPSGKLVLAVVGSLFLFLVLLGITATLKNRALGYIVLSMYLVLGLVMVIKHQIIGTAIYRANITLVRWVWRHVFMLSEEKVQQRITEFKALPLYGYKYHLVITFIIGLVLIAISVWSIIMIFQNKFF